MAWLTEGGDCRDGVMVLPEDIVEELEAASMGHAMWRGIFRDLRGGDWNVALFQARLIFESVAGKAAKKIEFATLKDNGDGSTGKGTLRELCEKALGVHNGGVERGYCAVLCQEALTVGKQERPHPGGSSDNTIPIPASSISLKQDITERTAQSTAQPSSMPEASELVRRYLQPYVLSKTRPHVPGGRLVHRRPAVCGTSSRRS